MADETEEAWEPYVGEEQEAWQAFDGEEPAPTKGRAPTQSLTAVKGEFQHDEQRPPASDAAQPPSEGGGAAVDVKKHEDEQDMPAYEPTSPASDGLEDKAFAGLAPEVETSGNHRATATDMAWQDTSELGARVNTTEAAMPVLGRGPQRQGPPPRLQREEIKKVIPCPALLVGSHLTKECMLKPGLWVEVGRHAKASVLMQNPGVSKHHCKLQWKRATSTVELRVLDGVVHVNDRRLEIGSSLLLQHGDLLKIHGKGVSYRMLINMQGVNPSLPDVRTMASYLTAFKDPQQSSRTPEEDTRRRIRKLRAAAAGARKRAMQKEETLTDLQTMRTLRSQRMEEALAKSRDLEKDEERLTGMLVASRDTWLDNLQKQIDGREEDIRPLNKLTAETQIKLDSLKFLKNQTERSLNPDRHFGGMPPTIPTSAASSPSPRKSAPENRFAARADEADGEEDALDPKKPTVEVLSKPKGDNEIADLFGDFGSDDEEQPEVKRARLE